MKKAFRQNKGTRKGEPTLEKRKNRYKELSGGRIRQYPDPKRLAVANGKRAGTLNRYSTGNYAV